MRTAAVNMLTKSNSTSALQPAAISIVHLDDDALYLEQFATALSNNSAGIQIELRQTTSQKQYFELLREHTPDVVVLDVNLAGTLRGPEVAVETRKSFPETVIFMCSSHKGIGIISACINAGADDFIFKGNDERELILRIAGTLRLRRPGSPVAAETNLASGATMQAVRERLTRIVTSAVTAIHISRESGTGKELVADCLAHTLPHGTAFVRVNCGAIAPTLIESELFGHVKGAFTGAQTDKPGLVEAAAGRVCELDERPLP